MAQYSDFTVNQDPKLVSSQYTALGVHPEYLNHYKRWEFLIKSYMGGYEYKLGQYLTKYMYESDSDYLRRLQTTPYDNHVKSITHIYNSFLYRQPIYRDFGNLKNLPELYHFFEDADLEGRTFESFMRDVNAMSTVYGHVLCLIDKPQSNAATRAEELNQNIRPYVSMFTPENILDWEYTRNASGIYELTYLKLLEVEQRALGMNYRYYVREFTPERIMIREFQPQKPAELLPINDMVNPLGKIPAVFVYANRSPIRGIGVSDVGDIADMSNAIFNELSEIEQLIRLSNHPSLVKTPEVDAAAGAGAIISMPNETDPGLKPYLLQPTGQSLDGIITSLDTKIKAIDRMAHMGAIRAIETRQMSGVAMQSEFLLLDAKLSEKAKNLQLAEEQIFRMWALWEGTVFDGTIKYPQAFHIRDKNLDMDILEKAARTNPADAQTKQLIDNKIKQLLADDDELYMMSNDINHSENENEEEDEEEMQHPTTTPDTKTQHVQEMIMQGYSDEEMLELHPELSQADITDAKKQLLGLNDADTQG